MGPITYLWPFLMVLGQTYPTPLFYSAPQSLTTLVTSASAASSGPISNIADLRQTSKFKLLDNNAEKDDDFFKEPLEKDYSDNREAEEMNNEASPGIIQKKIGKILKKIQFLSKLAAGNGDSDDKDNGDDFQKEQDDFDKEFQEDFGGSGDGNKTNERIEQFDGYVYKKPVRVIKSAKLESVGDNGLSFNAGGIGVFFMELIGSLVGLAYGAAAQINNAATATTATG